MDHNAGSRTDFREGRTDGNKLEKQPTIPAKVNIGVLQDLFGNTDPFAQLNDLKAKLPTKLPF